MGTSEAGGVAEGAAASIPVARSWYVSGRHGGIEPGRAHLDPRPTFHLKREGVAEALVASTELATTDSQFDRLLTQQANLVFDALQHVGIRLHERVQPGVDVRVQ